jgi:hypothetical protein
VTVLNVGRIKDEYATLCEWNLLGGLPETGPNGQQSGWRVRMVAGARNALNLTYL